jgi:hypothetical protein
VAVANFYSLSASNAAGALKECAVTKFVIKGTGDAAQAMLKENLTARDAKFNASLDAFFKAPVAVSASVPATPAVAGKAAAMAAPAKPAKTTGWELGKVRIHTVAR